MPMTPPDDRQRRSLRRTWPQRLTLVTVIVAAFGCFATAVALGAGQWVLSQRNLATLERPDSPPSGASNPEVVVPDLSGSGDAGDPSQDATPTTGAPLVLAEPDAANFLVVGADNNDCGDDPIVGDRTDLGERSDTIMVWRANPVTNQLAVLSFPRDLYVEFPSGARNRINSAYRRDDPSELQEVLNFNFGIQIDHYIQIDFCAFRRLVAAVGGIEVPFEFPARDEPRDGSGPLFQIDQTGCVNLDGDTALAYVRSRHYQYEDPPGSGEWHDDPTSDFGRISRQQDFLRRVLAKVIGEGLYDPDVASALITTNRKYLVTDPNLTVRRMLEFGNALRNFDPTSVTSYRIESTPQTTGDGQLVELPRIKSENMKAILAVFRGEATLANAPAQEFETGPGAATTTPGTTTTSTSIAPTSVPADETSEVSAPDESVPATTLPAVAAEENEVGVAPDRSVVCG
jgi:LCP family protein required for cell wall assembly